jgi:hypothetical protein
MTHHNQTKELTTRFLNLPLMIPLTTKAQSLNRRPHEAQLEDQKPMKSLRRSFRRRKTAKANKRHEKQQNHKKSKKSSKLTLPLDSHLSYFFSHPPD